MRINEATVDLVKRFEGCKLTAYQDHVGVWTIGYGVTAGAGVGIEPRKGMTITQIQADELLYQALDHFSQQVAALLTIKVSNNEFGACVSLAYNIGAKAFANSTLLRKLNANDHAGAAAEFKRWNKAGGEVLTGLTSRRAAEAALFLTPDIVVADMHVAAPKEDKKDTLLAVIIRAIMVLFGGK